jgi:signal transduction histidine kinase
VKPAGDKLKILIVDDRPENLLALQAVLSPEYEVLEALSGAEAISIARDHDFAAILLDVQMPELNGFETALLLRTSKRCESTPIIFVTAIHRTDDYEQQGYVAGAVDYLFKPINIDILRAKLSVFSQLHRQAEQLRDQAVKEKENEFLRETLLARDEFLSMASHELKTPITPLTLQLQSFLRMLRSDTFTKAPVETLIKMVETSYDQVERLDRTVDELLDVSRFITGNFELKAEPCHLSKLVTKVVNGFAEQLSEAKIEMTLDLDETVEGHWDCFRIEQVFINLLVNGIRYGKGSPIHVRVFRENTFAILEVRDEGIGIDLEDQERIFKRFERASSPRHYGGLGLGLYIASKIVSLHGGAIHVESAPEKGSTFTVRLPLETKAT